MFMLENNFVGRYPIKRFIFGEQIFSVEIFTYLNWLEL